MFALLLGPCQGVKSYIIGECLHINRLSLTKIYALQSLDLALSDTSPTLLAPTGICFLGPATSSAYFSFFPLIGPEHTWLGYVMS